MSNLTPNTDNVRSAYVCFCVDVSGRDDEYVEELEAEFGRWLNSVKAEAWDECMDSVMEHIERHGTSTAGWPKNPYRTGGAE